MKENALTNLAISDNGLLLNGETGKAYSLNSTAIFILQNLIDGTDFESLIVAMLKKYTVSELLIRRDLDDFIDRLKSSAILNKDIFKR